MRDAQGNIREEDIDNAECGPLSHFDFECLRHISLLLLD